MSKWTLMNGVLTPIENPEQPERNQQFSGEVGTIWTLESWIPAGKSSTRLRVSWPCSSNSTSDSFGMLWEAARFNGATG
ncbi:hypothetical protein L596_011816 [Steinernema carpocapsae]|uniref:Uncharacterized protein n=1 Tax=Steinernema carpocapsae TaxID=34508 RepID=A0A4V6A4L5_STECR|nr:hypothetical protein L596_011816 [Steinernema carpocapsae]